MWRLESSASCATIIILRFLMFPKLIDLWNSAKVEIENADYMIVIGYSFAEADTYITKIVARSMSVNKNQKMIVV